jgi:hypothetical protein
VWKIKLVGITRRKDTKGWKKGVRVDTVYIGKVLSTTFRLIIERKKSGLRILSFGLFVVKPSLLSPLRDTIKSNTSKGP